MLIQAVRKSERRLIVEVLIGKNMAEGRQGTSWMRDTRAPIARRECASVNMAVKGLGIW